MPQWKQYSGIWTPTQQAQAVGDNNWPGVVLDELYVWGNNGSYGQLGTGNVAAVSSPTQIGTETYWTGPVANIRMQASFFNTSAGLFSVGSNDYGQLGLGDVTHRSSPVQVGPENDWTAFSRAGETTVHGIRGGRLFGWGSNGSGMVGDSTDLRRSSPVQIGALTTWESCADSDNCAAGISGNKLYTWGTNDGYGLRGANNAAIADASSPVQVGALTDWATVDSGKQFFMATKTDGTLWGWGLSDKGQVPTGVSSGFGFSYSSPVQIGSLTTWASVSCGLDFAAAIKTDGTLWTWGENSLGQLGDGTVILRSSPVQVGALTDWTKTEGGAARTTAQRSSGVLYMTGNIYARLGNNTASATTNTSSPVQLAEAQAWNEWSAWDSPLAVKRTIIT